MRSAFPASGWAIIDAENEAQARLAVPRLVRNRARIIKLNKFDATSIEDYEKQEAVAAWSGGRLAGCERDHRHTDLLRA